jgi:hypothetical protein
VARGIIRCVFRFAQEPDWVRGKSMLTCPKCHAGIPQGMRFCLQCGASLAPLPPSVAPAPPMPVTPSRQQPHRAATTVPLKIAVSPMIASRAGPAAKFPRPSLGELRVEVDEESLKKSFARPIAQPGVVVCRFCKGPLDLAGDFCDQCGAPVAEAAPPGALKPQPRPAEPAVPLHATGTLPSSPPVDAPGASASAQHPGVAASPLTMPATLMEPVDPAPALTPGPAAPTSPPTPPADEHSGGFVSRLKGLFKKG